MYREVTFDNFFSLVASCGMFSVVEPFDILSVVIGLLFILIITLYCRLYQHDETVLYLSSLGTLRSLGYKLARKLINCDNVNPLETGKEIIVHLPT